MNKKLENRMLEIIEKSYQQERSILDLSHLKIRDKDLPMVIKALKGNPFFTGLNLSHNLLFNPRLLGEYLKSNTKIEKVNLSHNVMQYPQTEDLVKDLMGNSSIVAFDVDMRPNVKKKLDWEHHYIHKVRKLLERNQLIHNIAEQFHTKMTLRFNSLNYQDVSIMVNSLLSKGVEWLDKIDLSDSSLQLDANVVKMLKELIVKNLGLKEVILSNNQIRGHVFGFQEELERQGIRCCVKGVTFSAPTLYDGMRDVEFYTTYAPKVSGQFDVDESHLHFRKKLVSEVSFGRWTSTDIQLSESDFSGVELSYMNLSNAIVQDKKPKVYRRYEVAEEEKEVKIHFPERMCGSNCYTSKFIRADLSGRWINDANLRMANFAGAKLKGANFSNSNLTGACFYLAHMKGVIMRNVVAENVDFSEAKLRRADMRGANCKNTLFAKADLRDADLRQVNFNGANLFEADLRGANLAGCNLTNTIGLAYARLDGACLLGTKLPNQSWTHQKAERLAQDAARVQGRLWKYSKIHAVFGKLGKSSEANFSDLTTSELKQLHNSGKRRKAKAFIEKYDRYIKEENRGKVYHDVYLERVFDTLGLPDNAKEKLHEMVDEMPAEAFIKV